MSSLDQYEVLETLGTGSFGSVAKLRRRADGRILVWKEINFGGMSEKEKSQLVAEVNILRELRNPFIVRYHDRIVDKPRTRLYIIMENCPGGDLGRLIRRHRQTQSWVDERFIWRVFAQSILALKECHRRQEGNETKPIIHRDLKPANILLDADNNIKMADFGLAKELSSRSRLCKTNVGTPYYMAPEIINERAYDEKSDIWSLGCLLYELAALKPPFDAHNAVSLAMKINSGRFARIPTRYSDALSDAIRSMIQLEPTRRPRVEDLEAMPALASAMGPARRIVNEFHSAAVAAGRAREMKGREDALVAREEEVARRESALECREQKLKLHEESLNAREEALAIKEANIRAMQEQFEARQQQQYQLYEQRRLSNDLAMGDEMLKRINLNEDTIPPPPQSRHSTTTAVPSGVRRGPVPIPMNAAQFTIHSDSDKENLPGATPTMAKVMTKPVTGVYKQSKPVLTENRVTNQFADPLVPPPPTAATSGADSPAKRPRLGLQQQMASAALQQANIAAYAKAQAVKHHQHLLAAGGLRNR